MKRYIVYTLIFVSIYSTNLFGQHDAATNHYWITPSVLNPALIGLVNDTTINISASLSDYWVAMPEAPQTISAILEVPFPNKKIALGAFFRQEKHFLIKETRGQLTFNYEFPFPKIKSEFRLGLGVGFLENRIDFSRASVKATNDPLVLNSIQSQLAFHLAMAVAFRHKKLRIGMTIPYLITSKSSRVGSFLYGNNNINTTSFQKPLMLSFYVRQALLPKEISKNIHELDIAVVTNIPVVPLTENPYDIRLNVIYQIQNFDKNNDKKTVTKALRFTRFSVGAGLGVAWKNNESLEEKKANAVGSALFGVEMNNFFEVNYSFGINSRLSTLGTTHEIICKIYIDPQRKSNAIKKNREDILLLRNEINDQLNIIRTEHKKLKEKIEAINFVQKTEISLLKEALEKLQNDIEDLKNMKVSKPDLKQEIKDMEKNIQEWIKALRQQVNITVPPSSLN
ncbi:PorP/SprF family type IX secretion system membrane protein [Aureispira anguillae]|uniref:PorP/SprF family type IX secretion system membrane protein n=1 Tax=Aureispira anguillae TaxID=2864201 RepID=A0A915YM84_9BACT|nr:PorP/SprF family type IX secretion system membrane protein [Aureispira anguillae]BDS15705.1 PorP/SprF family type IX secretion system membrane protein [Aureispira anguillae]